MDARPDDSSTLLPGKRIARAWMPAAAAVLSVGWGVNQFTPLSVIYRIDEHWSALDVAVMFSMYLVGLVPALLCGRRLSERFGRRVVRPALALSAVASVMLTFATLSPAPVYVSRLLAGLTAGVILAAGTAWVGELSARAGRADASRERVLLATGGGFAAGALVSGCLVEWLPHPMVVPGLVHALLVLLVLVATWRLPETAPRDAAPESTGHRVRSAMAALASHPRFVLVVLPASPAVFAAATVAYVVLPPLVSDRVSGYEPLFSGLVTALTLAVGVAIQPLVTRIDHSGSARATLTAMVTVIAGLLVGALAVQQDSILLVLVASASLGAGYGLTLVSGTKELERIVSPAALPSAMAIYQGAAHSGLLTPLLLTVTAGSASYPVLLVVLALVGLAFLTLTAAFSRRHLP